MKLDGSAVLYQLSCEFDEVTCETALRAVSVDYPLLYDVNIDMSGHVILVPDHERPQGGEHMRNVLCVCLGEMSALAAVEAGLCTIWVRGNVTFQHLYNRMQRVFVRNERFEAQLRAYVDTYAGYQPLLDACSQSMGFDCLLIDEQLRVVCQATNPDSRNADSKETDMVTELLEDNALDLFMASERYKRMREQRKVFVMPGSDRIFIRNVYSGNRLIGALVMRHGGDAMSARYVRFLLNYLAPFIEDMYERIGTLDPNATLPTQIRHAFKGALSGDAESFTLLESLLEDTSTPRGKSGRNKPMEYVILHVERSFTHDGPEGLPYFARRLEQAWPQAHCVEHEGVLYALAGTQTSAHDPHPSAKQSRLTNALSPILRDNLAKAGVSRMFSNIAGIPAARAQADAALACGNVNDPAFWLYRFDDYALDYIVTYGCSDIEPEYMAHQAIFSLIHYDEEQDADLLHTLDAFMRNRFNATQAARELYIARSTLINRLERIVELTGIDLNDPDELTYLAVSLRILDR